MDSKKLSSEPVQRYDDEFGNYRGSASGGRRLGKTAVFMAADRMPSESLFDDLRELVNTETQQEFLLEKHITQDSKAQFALHIVKWKLYEYPIFG
ncbi:MAG: hypothetical protein M1839_004739 [Geoglossum umbratile]|nr:MAG: hypothetical protein M1839_004739 [Geoglossum umbratile]